MDTKGMNLGDILAEFSEHLQGMWRFRWSAVGIAWLASVGAWTFIYSMPSVYQGSAQVYVDSSSLMDPVFKDLALRDNLTAQLRAVSQALLTRPNVEAMARETGIDRRAKTPQQKERLISQLQQRIEVEPRRRENVFNVAYRDTDRDMAQAVVAAIVAAFMRNSLENEGDDAEMTARALETEIRDHEERLRSAEDALTEFKQENIGYMPNDRGDYYSRLQSSLSDVSRVEEQLQFAGERRDELRRQIEGEAPILGMSAEDASQGIVGCSREGQVNQLESELSRLLVNYTERHPRVISLRETIGSLREECVQEFAAGGGASMRSGSLANGAAANNPIYQNLRLQISETEVEIAGLRAQLSTKRQEVAQLRADVNKIAEVEAQLKQLNRDYSVVQGRYQELLKRRETLRSMQRLEPVADPVKLRLIEPPFAPLKPVAPNRPLLALAALVFGVSLGVVVAFGLNQLKPVFFTRRSVRRSVGLPVLGSVSLLLSPKQIRAQRFGTFVWASCSVLLFITAAAVVTFEAEGASVVRQLLEQVSI